MSLDSNFIGVLIGHYLYQSSDLDEFEILHMQFCQNSETEVCFKLNERA